MTLFTGKFKFPTSGLFLILFFTLLITACQEDPVLEPADNEDVIIAPKSRAFITGIQINSFPGTDPSGNSWDAIDTTTGDVNGEADIFFNITDPSPNPPVFWSQNSHFSDVGSNDTTRYNLLENYEVIPFGSNIDVNVYDYELPDSTLIGTVNFFVGTYPDPQNPYPSAVLAEQNGCSVILFLRWED